MSVECDTFLPVGAGDMTELICAGTNWEYVSDESDSTYVYNDTGSTTKTDLYSFATNIPARARIIDITVFTRSYQTWGSEVSGSVKASLKINGSVYHTSSVSYYSDTVTTRNWQFLTNPDTGNPWTPNEVNSAQFGHSFSCNPSGTPQRGTKLWITVLYVLPDVGCSTILARPTSDGDRTEMECGGDHWDYLSDLSNSTSAHSGVDGATKIDLFHSTSFVFPGDALNVADVHVFTNANGGTLNPSAGTIIKIGSTEYGPYTEGFSSANNPRFTHHTWSTNPATSLPWEKTDFITMQFGASSYDATGAYYGWSNIYEVLVVIEYEVAASSAPIMW